MPEPLRILQIAPRFPYPLLDGGAIGIYNITKSLAQLGHEVTLVTFPLDDAEETKRGVAEISQFARVRLTSRPLPSRMSVLARTVFRGAYPIERRMMPEMFELLTRVVGETKFDVVHVDHAHMGRYGRWLHDEFGLPIVIREHNFECLIYERYAAVEPNPFKKLVAKIHGARLRREETQMLQGAAIAAITEEDALAMRSVAPGADIRVIPAGVDGLYFRPSEIALQEPGSVLWIGSMDWDPNFDAISHFLENIFPKIRKAIPSAIFTLIGGGQARLAKLLEKTEQAHPGSTRALGIVPDIRDYLARSSVLVVPLRIGGGMRLKLLEFFAAGKATVSTRIGAEGNLAKDGRELLLRDSDDEFASGVVQLLQDEKLRRQIGDDARALIEQRYTWQSIARELTNFYEDVIARSKS